ncbi:hypothetical protein BOTBODRAFT_38780 [Botryobasidium botryosum FD-172 SS1]|uniref:Uncharacterized protein n=1 Tax=Botryobasidium botryosum (strain FD-172 SS1) TaxID=930990 RepID=A0A067M6I0_BOTB1|nr:hypothetical protein BOTBODRAFT_38780 [Botryobasidium botryosum FD-172 SS1]
MFNKPRSNFKNDAELHKLLHTKLLSGSLNPDLGLTSAQRRKALEGRVLELASGTRLGRGESVVRQSEKNKASKRVRDGLNAKKVEREKKELDEAKNLGNYHPTLKKLFAASGSTSNGGKRERGLKLGVGKFTGGMLKLSREEIGSVEGRSRGGRGGGRGRGGGGRGRGRGHGSKRGRH